MSEQQLANANRLIRKAHHEKNEQDARQRFKQIIKKKFTTTFIFCLAEFERSFGHLWGHGKEEGELTETEFTQRKLWEAVRCDGNLIDREKNPVDERGELIITTAPFLDDETGEPIVIEQPTKTEKKPKRARKLSAVVSILNRSNKFLVWYCHGDAKKMSQISVGSFAWCCSWALSVHKIFFVSPYLVLMRI